MNQGPYQKVTQWHAATGTEGKWRCYSDPFATSALEICEWSAPGSGKFIPRKDQCPSYRRLGGPQCRSGQHAKSCPTGIWSPDLPARTESLYRLSCSQWYTLQKPRFFKNMLPISVVKADGYRSGKLHNDKRSCNREAFLRKFLIERLNLGIRLR